MLHRISMTPPQAKTLADWVDTSPDMADVLIDKDFSTLVVGQGDSRCRILASGHVIEEA